MRGVWFKNLEHEGVQVSHQSKPEAEVIEKLKQAGFRWSRRQRLWYAKGTPNQVRLLNEIADYGGEVGKKLTFEEKMEAKLESAERRTEYYQKKAEATEQEATQLFEKADKMAEIIPFGQPILVGHYSEGRDRRYREKISNTILKSIETQRKAEYYKNRAEASSGFKERAFNLATTLRRIERLKAEWRRYYRELDDQYVRIFQGYEKSISRVSLERAERAMERIEEEISYWNKTVADSEDDGLKVWGPSDFSVGEKIEVDGIAAQVLKINPKTLWVKMEAPWLGKLATRKVSYTKLSQNCKGSSK